MVATPMSLSRKQRRDRWTAMRRVRDLARQIPNETVLRRLLSETRDPVLRRAVFRHIRPFLRFTLSDTLRLEALDGYEDEHGRPAPESVPGDAH